MFSGRNASHNEAALLSVGFHPIQQSPDVDLRTAFVGSFEFGVSQIFQSEMSGPQKELYLWIDDTRQLIRRRTRISICEIFWPFRLP